MRRIVTLAGALGLWGLALSGASRSPAPPFDLLIVNARLLDGSGNPWRRADVAVRDGRIAAVGHLRGASASQTIDAGDRLVAPGFIDAHSHAAESLTRDALRDARPLIAQGVTTIIGNPDGGGPIDLAAQRAALERGGTGVNVGLLIGHGSVRSHVIGAADRAPSEAELARMTAIVTRAAGEGALGLSSGLFYAPGSFAKLDEVIALARAAGGVYASHIRDEGDYSIGLIAAVQEVIDVAERAGVRGIVTHIKALGPASWGLGGAAATRIDLARARGVDVLADQYVYDASSTSLSAAVVPRWAQAGGDAAFRARSAGPAERVRILAEMRENIRRRGGARAIVIASHAADRALEGQTLEQIAEARRASAETAALAIAEAGGASIVSFNMSEDDIVTLMRRPWMMTSSDGALSLAGEGRPHPRNNGAFTRKLTRYVRDRGVVTLEDAVRSMTSLPAATFGLTGRGVIEAGAFADLVVFDLSALRERATYDDPHQMSEGMWLVLVNGQPVIERGAFTGRRPGRILRAGN
ncbi:MAG: amidohydrolase family protein [Acidobacteriota bacterium]|nr:amidohydrolase family protein [Acidobacteriota bacterium]